MDLYDPTQIIWLNSRLHCLRSDLGSPITQGSSNNTLNKQQNLHPHRKSKTEKPRQEQSSEEFEKERTDVLQRNERTSEASLKKKKPFYSQGTFPNILQGREVEKLRLG